MFYQAQMEGGCTRESRAHLCVKFTSVADRGIDACKEMRREVDVEKELAGKKRRRDSEMLENNIMVNHPYVWNNPDIWTMGGWKFIVAGRTLVRVRCRAEVAGRELKHRHTSIAF